MSRPSGIPRLQAWEEVNLSASQTWKPGKAEILEELYSREPAVRHAFRVCSFAWGIGLLGEALLRVPLVYMFPVRVMVGLSTAMMITVMVPWRPGTRCTSPGRVARLLHWLCCFPHVHGKAQGLLISGGRGKTGARRGQRKHASWRHGGADRCAPAQMRPARALVSRRLRCRPHRGRDAPVEDAPE